MQIHIDRLAGRQRERGRGEPREMRVAMSPKLSMPIHIILHLSLAQSLFIFVILAKLSTICGAGQIFGQ
jgi:hypothetical protein